MTPITDEIMGQAQVFASAWALVGSRFDSGDEMDRANGEKACLHGMIEALTKERDTLAAAAKLALYALSVSYPTVRSRLRAHNKAIEELRQAGVK